MNVYIVRVFPEGKIIGVTSSPAKADALIEETKKEMVDTGIKISYYVEKHSII